MTETRIHRALLEQERQVGSLTPLLWMTRRSARLTGAAHEKNSPKTTLVTNSATAFFKPLVEINPFESHRGQLLQFGANLGMCFSFTAYMTH